MIKLAIVDDELLMSDFLKNCTDYNAIGITVSGIFCDGAEALDAFRTQMPDIVVTDIKMPDVDGVELLRECIKLDENVRFVVISNYQDFHVVKNVLGLGACDYILKTEFDIDDYVNILKGIVKQIQDGENSDAEDVFGKNHELKQLFWNNRKSLADSTYSLRITGDNVLMCVVFIINHEEIVKEQWEMSKEFMQAGLHNYFEEVLSKFGNGEIIFNSYDELILIFSEDEKSGDIEALLEEAAVFLREYFYLEVFGIMGSCDFSGESMRKKYEELRSNRDLYHIVKKSIVSEKEIKTTYTQEFVAYDEVKLCEKWLDTLEFDLIEAELKAIKKKKFSAKSVRSVYEFIEMLTVRLNKMIEDHKISIKDAGSDAGKGIRKMDKEIDDLLLKLDTVRNVISQGREKYDIEQYVKNNYSNPNLTLEEVAKEFNYEYSYFSRYFLKLTKKTFKRYLNDLRLDMARKLILSTDFKCNEIAHMVGYSCYEHFSRAYNKRFGKSPNEVRKSANN